jgi:hypothetical protein
MGKPAILKINIISDEDTRAFDRAGKSASKFERGLSKASKGAAVVLGALALAARGMVREAEAASTSNARLAQINESMGQTQAGVTDAMIKTADAMARKTGINANEIKQGQAILATFGNINNAAARQAGVFDRATASAADLSAAGFGSVDSAAKQLGKALEDPIKGMTALTRVGVSFTAAEQEKIAALVQSGDLLAAQDVLLKAVEKQTGGVAVATANSTDKMAESWRQAQAALGTALLPVVDKAAALLGVLTDWMIRNQGAVVRVVAAVAALSAGILVLNAAFKVGRAVVAAYNAVHKILAVVLRVSTGETVRHRAATIASTAASKVARVAVIAWTAAQKLLNVALRSNPIGIVITLAAALAAGIVALYQRSERFRSIVQKAGQVAKTAFQVVLRAAKPLISVVSSIISFVMRLVNAIRSIRWPEPPGWVKSIGSAIGGLFGASEYAPGEPGAILTPSFSPAHRMGFMPHIGGGSSDLALAALGARGGGGVTIINVNGALDPDAVARQIERLLQRRSARTGRNIVSRTVRA